MEKDNAGRNFQPENEKGNLKDHLREQNKDYKNVENAVNNPNYFDDDYAVQQEDEISNNEGKTENEARIGQGRRKPNS